MVSSAFRSLTACLGRHVCLVGGREETGRMIEGGLALELRVRMLDSSSTQTNAAIFINPRF